MERFVAEAEQLLSHVDEDIQNYGIGLISEFYDGNPPYVGHGCISQARNTARLSVVSTLSSAIEKEIQRKCKIKVNPKTNHYMKKIKVLMFGWEFPPHISGGLGTACLGLTKGLAKNEVEVLFVMPRPLETKTLKRLALSMPARKRCLRIIPFPRTMQSILSSWK